MDHKPEPNRPGYKAQDDTKAYLSLAVLFAVLFFVMVLFWRELVISLKSGNMARGISSVPWVGFANYEKLLHSYVLLNLLRNTIILSAHTVIPVIWLSEILDYSTRYMELLL